MNLFRIVPFLLVIQFSSVLSANDEFSNRDDDLKPFRLGMFETVFNFFGKTPAMFGHCAGRWAYKKFNSCEDKTFGIASHKKERSKHCGIAEYKERSGSECGFKQYAQRRGHQCGVELYNEGTDYPCDVAYWTKECRKRNTGFLDCINGCSCRIEANVPHYHTCRHKDFGVERYHSCRHRDFGVEYHSCRNSAFGVDTFKECEHENHGVAKFKKGQGPVCGLESDIRFTERGFVGNISNAEPYLVNEETSACTTCDDLESANKEQVKKKFKCLKASIKNAEKGTYGYGYPDLVVAVKAIKNLQYSFSSMLTNEDNDYIFSLLNTYPTLDSDIKCL